MGKFPAFTDKDVTKRLRKLGCYREPRRKGGHEIWINPKTHKRFPIPRHSGKIIKRATLKSIVEDTGLTVEEFVKL